MASLKFIAAFILRRKNQMMKWIKNTATFQPTYPNFGNIRNEQNVLLLKKFVPVSKAYRLCITEHNGISSEKNNNTVFKYACL